MKLFILMLGVFFVVGCSNSYNYKFLKEPPSKLRKEVGVFLIIPKDGWYGNKTYNNSGKMTSQALKNEFLNYTSSVHISSECKEINECLKIIPEKKYNYLVLPEIMHWEDRATEWSGKPDKIKIHILIYNIYSKEEICSAMVESKSGLGTFGGDHPQDLLPKSFKLFMNSLY